MFKVLTLLFIFFVILRTILRFKDNSISLREFIFWIGLWSVATLFVLEPNISNYLAQAINIGRGVDTIFYLSIIFIFYTLFRIYVKIEKLDRDITELTINASKKYNVSSKK